MIWYRDKRIKLEHGMSIMDKRAQLVEVPEATRYSGKTTIQATKFNKTSRSSGLNNKP